MREKARASVSNEALDNNHHDQDEESTLSSDRSAQLFLAQNEGSLLKWVADINRIYEEKLRKPAPFMTFVLCGMQSTGKSTIMERFLGAPLNIVQEGTGTRCPLDTTCIHDPTATEPNCELSGLELDPDHQGKDLGTDKVFEYVTNHNKKLDSKDEFSVEPLRLIYKSKTVQNMRFVDTPGLISNLSTGKDNRKDIMDILRNSMRKPNAKLCLLLEPKEFATNAIISFLDETFGDRMSWLGKAIPVMTKFDKQFEDSRTGSKANNFFKEYLANHFAPYLVSTPTLAKESLPPAELYEKRKELISSANEVEKDRFKLWIDGHKTYNDQEGGTDELLKQDIADRIGFPAVVTAMRNTMLEHTYKQLPIVLKEIREELTHLSKEQKILKERLKFSDPGELKTIVILFLSEIQKRITTYLDGSMKASITFASRSLTLAEEIDDEEDSEWCDMELNHHTDFEDNWRCLVAGILERRFHKMHFLQPIKEKFLGGKQIHRAVEFFAFAMIGALYIHAYVEFILTSMEENIKALTESMKYVQKLQRGY